MPRRRSLRPDPQPISFPSRLLVALGPFLFGCVILWRLINPAGSRDTRGFNPFFGWALLAVMVAAVVYLFTMGFGGWALGVNRAAKYLIKGVVALIVVVLVLGALVLPHVFDGSLGARDLGGPGGARLLGVLGLVGVLAGVFFWLRARWRKRSGD